MTSLLSSSSSNINAPSLAVSKFVKFNVKGRHFTILRDTLLAVTDEEGNFFTALLSGKFGTLLDSDGNIYIDRNPDYFDAVLDIIQMQEYFCPAHLNEQRLKKELTFYGVLKLRRVSSSVDTNDNNNNNKQTITVGGGGGNSNSNSSNSGVNSGNQQQQQMTARRDALSDASFRALIRNKVTELRRNRKIDADARENAFILAHAGELEVVAKAVFALLKKSVDLLVPRDEKKFARLVNCSDNDGEDDDANNSWSLHGDPEPATTAGSTNHHESVALCIAQSSFATAVGANAVGHNYPPDPRIPTYKSNNVDHVMLFDNAVLSIALVVAPYLAAYMRAKYNLTIQVFGGDVCFFHHYRIIEDYWKLISGVSTSKKEFDEYTITRYPCVTVYW